MWLMEMPIDAELALNIINACAQRPIDISDMKCEEIKGVCPNTKRPMGIKNIHMMKEINQFCEFEAVLVRW